MAPIKGKTTIQMAQVWSFHEAEFPISYPLREGG